MIGSFSQFKSSGVIQQNSSRSRPSSRDSLMSASGSRNVYVLAPFAFLPTLASPTCSLRVGQQAPDFTATAVVDQEFKEITLSQYRGKYVVLFSIPWTSPSCVPRRSLHSAIATPISPARTQKFLCVCRQSVQPPSLGFRPPVTKAASATSTIPCR